MLNKMKYLTQLTAECRRRLKNCPHILTKGKVQATDTGGYVSGLSTSVPRDVTCRFIILLDRLIDPTPRVYVGLESKDAALIARVAKRMPSVEKVDDGDLTFNKFYQLRSGKRAAVLAKQYVHETYQDNKKSYVGVYFEPRDVASDAAICIQARSDIMQFLSKVAPTRIIAPKQKKFDAKTARGVRKRIRQLVALRRGQPTFRRNLMQAYGARCAITGCDVPDALEAAHIQPYRGAPSHHVQNGLLLRGDLHALFDRNLIGIDPINWSVLVHDSIRRTAFGGSLAALTLRLPENVDDHPDHACLAKQARRVDPTRGKKPVAAAAQPAQ